MCFNCVFYTSHYIRSLRNNAHRTEFNSKFEQAYGSRHAYHDAILYECGNLEFVEYIVYRYIDVYIQFVFRPPISISLDSIIHARKIFFLFTMTLEDEKNWKLTTIYWNRLQSTIAFLVRLEYIEGLFPIFCHNSCDIDCWHFFRVENFFPFEYFMMMIFPFVHDDDIAIVFQIEGITTNANGMVSDLMVLIWSQVFRMSKPDILFPT